MKYNNLIPNFYINNVSEDIYNLSDINTPLNKNTNTNSNS